MTGTGIKKIIRILAAFAMALAFAAPIAFVAMPHRGTAHANSAAPIWYGGGLTGALANGDECPLEVKHETLTFDVRTLPNAYYHADEDFMAYSGSVTAEYTFANPEDYDVTAKMMFPFGVAPYYGGNIDFEACFDEIAKSYKVKVDGEPVETRLRHSYVAYRTEGYYEFETERDLGKLNDGYCDDEFFEPDMTVTKYTYIARGIKYSDKYYYPAYAVAAADYDAQKTRIISNADMRESARFGKNVMTGDSIEIYAVGMPLDADPEFIMYDDILMKAEVGGEMYLASKTSMTFKDLMLTYRCTDSAASETDWYNAAVFSLKREIEQNGYWYDKEGFFGSADARIFDVTGNLLRWYEYEMTVPAKSTVVNAVTAPSYPSIVGNNYFFSYLLSPASTWKSFGTLDINIRSNFGLSQCYVSANGGTRHESLNDKFKLQDGVYSASLDSLPNGELYFSVSSGSNNKSTFYNTMNSIAYFVGFFPYMLADSPILVFAVAFGSALILTALVCAIVLPIAFIAKKKDPNMRN